MKSLWAILKSSGGEQSSRGAARRRRVLPMLGLAVFLLAQVGAAAPLPPDIPALVRIDLPGEAALGALATQGLQVYTQIGRGQGGLILAAQASHGQQAALTRQGYTVQVLDVDARQAVYYLLYGMPEDLQQAAQAPGDTIHLWLVEGRQAVASVSGDGLTHLEALGIGWLPLAAQPLHAPVAWQVARMESATSPLPLVQRMIDEVQAPTLAQYVGELSGEQPVMVNGEPYTIATRYTLAGDPIKKATRFAYQHFQEIGLPVVFDDYILPGFNLPRRNVIAQQSGVSQPERIFLLTAHLDSTAGGDPYTMAPGADDNASGSAAVMRIAEILRAYRFDCTLRYALYTGEEQGLFGSTAYANEVMQAEENVQAVLNLDMLGYNTPGSHPSIELHTRPSNASDLAVAQLFTDAVGAYGLNLAPQILQDRLSFSDHAPFWDRNYTAILAIEDWQDHTPDYHSVRDRLQTLDLPYYTDFVKASLATLVHMGCLLDGELSGVVSEVGLGLPLADAQVQVWQNGQRISTLVSQANGTYQSLLVQGSYNVVFAAPDHRTEMVNGVAVTAGQITDLDGALQPCNTVKQPSFSALPNPVDPGQTVTFSAQVSDGQAPVTYNWNFGDGQTGVGQVVTHTYTTLGVYAVKLSADNACAYPLDASRSVFVGKAFLFFPLIGR